MPCLSGAYDPAHGVLLKVGIFPGGFLADIKQNPNQTIESTKHMFHGLVDTGADNTCISSAAVQSIKLNPVGKTAVHGATGSSQMNQYRIDFMLEFGNQQITMPNLIAIEYSANSNVYDVLIGRDIICSGVLTMDFNGHFSFSI